MNVLPPVTPLKPQNSETPVITCLLTDQAEITKIVLAEAKNGKPYFRITLIIKGNEVTLPADEFCGIGKVNRWKAIYIELRQVKSQNGFINWSPWISKIEPLDIQEDPAGV